MPKTVLISLAAVVALIVIVILLGMRYLRADDEDDFDDDVPAEHDRYPHDPGRPRREHDDLPHDRFRQRPRAAPGGRASAGRPAGRAPSRVADDRGWSEQDGHAARHGLLPQRDSHSARSGSRRDRDDVSEPAVASARRGYQGQDRADTRGADDRDYLQARDGRDRRDARTPAGSREIAVADRDGRDRRSESRPSQRQDSGRRNGAASDQDELLPAIKPRQGRSKRDADGDWPSNEWDELSDVDYWAELAADKPLTTPTPAEQSGTRRRGARSGASELHPRVRDTGRAEREARQRDAVPPPERAVMPAVTRQFDQAPADRSEDLIGNGSRRASLGRTEQLHAAPLSPGTGRDGLQPRNPVPPDDDPLTSPSFPRIAADDSRSYRRAKRSVADEPEPGGLTRDGSTQPHSYSPPAGLPVDNGATYPRAAPSAPYISPDADPYASVPNSNSVPGYPAPGSYALPGGQASGSYPNGGGGYVGPADAGRNGYYQPPADPASFRPHAADSGSYQSPPGGYPDADYGGHLPPATTAGYPISGNATEYRDDQADFASPYPPYGDHRQSVVPQPQPDPGYLPSGYGAGHETGVHPSLPGHLEPGYPFYQAPVAASDGSPYPPGGGQLPGPSAGYQDPYQPGRYDHAGYPSPAPQPGYAGTDPYAADPYGYSEYGSGGR